jgi:N-acetylglutamate synthase/N-acetylornithine aminotransferase
MSFTLIPFQYKIAYFYHHIMKNREYSITIDLNLGNFEAKVYTTDLTKEYIAINADYRS